MDEGIRVFADINEIKKVMRSRFKLILAKTLREIANDIDNDECEIEDINLSGYTDDPWYKLSFRYKHK